MARLLVALCVACFFTIAYAQMDDMVDPRVQEARMENITRPIITFNFSREGKIMCEMLCFYRAFHQVNMNTSHTMDGTIILHIQSGAVQVCARDKRCGVVKFYWCLNVADMPLERKVPIDYHDGVYDPSGNDRPNVMIISNLTFEGLTGLGSERRTALFTFYGKKPYHFELSNFEDVNIFL